jgi:diguanylate cyclase (GGDEF)-like protein
VTLEDLSRLNAVDLVKRHYSLLALQALLLTWSSVASPAQVAAIPDIDLAEELTWADSSAALRLLDKLQPAAQHGDNQVQWLLIRGLAHADVRDEEHGRDIVRRLHELGHDSTAAEAASHIVQASLFLHGEQLDRAEAELKLIGADTALPDYERFRAGILLGDALVVTGRQEAALSAWEKALDLANTMHSVTRAVEAMDLVSEMALQMGNVDRAASLAKRARDEAQRSGDDIPLTRISTLDVEVAEARGDIPAERRALLEALAHAKRTSSDKAMTEVLLYLGDFYLKAGDYATSLNYSKQGLVPAHRLRRPLLELNLLSIEGFAEIGLGHLAQGKRLADDAIRQILASGDLVDADAWMREYLPALERAGDLRGAMEVYHRDDKVHEQVMTAARQKALLELSAKFDDERRTRRIELLERDNAIKSADLQAQLLRQQMIIMAAALIVLTCAALAWGIIRIRKVNTRLLYNSQHDLLTGFLNRRYFNDHILAQHGNRPYLGCLLLVDIDHLERINDTHGHQAGDEVLRTLSKRLADTLPDSDALARWSGGKFLVMLGPMSIAQLNVLARRLLAAIRSEPVLCSGQAIRCAASIGYASFPVQGASVDISLDRALSLVNQALQQAKHRGRDRACLVVLVNAASEQELSAINAHFAQATADDRVQLQETVDANVRS